MPKVNLNCLDMHIASLWWKANCGPSWFTIIAALVLAFVLIRTAWLILRWVILPLILIMIFTVCRVIKQIARRA